MASGNASINASSCALADSNFSAASFSRCYRRFTIAAFLILQVAALHAAAAPRAGLPAWLALLLPFYWLLHWAALLLALSDLVRDPAHWRKTEHGCAERARAA